MITTSIIKGFYDISLSGKRTSEGAIEELYNKKAFENSIILWMTSMKGDYIRNPLRGGYLIPLLAYPMSPEAAKEISEAILVGLRLDYDKNLVLTSLSVIPEYDSETWIINLTAYSPEIKDLIEIETYLKSLT
jgi:hypothetical protein